MTSLDRSISGIDPEPDALLRVQVPERVPRRLEAGQNRKILGGHSFFLVFGSIWAGVGGVVTLAFSVIAFAAAACAVETAFTRRFACLALLARLSPMVVYLSKVSGGDTTSSPEFSILRL